MAISVELELTDAERTQLASILGSAPDALDDAIASFATAALEEYARMFLGQRVFTRGSDAREFRLLLLIKHAFANRFPDDQRISDFFQTTLQLVHLHLCLFDAAFGAPDDGPRFLGITDETLNIVTRLVGFSGGKMLVCLISIPACNVDVEFRLFFAPRFGSCD